MTWVSEQDCILEQIEMDLERESKEPAAVDRRLGAFGDMQ